MSDSPSSTSSVTTHSPRDQRRARVLRPWRIALVLYAAILTIATHWPRLQFSAEIPSNDKAIHAMAFAAATLLLWRSGWFGPRWLIGVIALAWAATDEVSQGIPAIHRTVSWLDLIANVCGVISAMAMLWAMRPLRVRSDFACPSETRSRLFTFTFDQMFARVAPWLVGVAVGVVTASIVVIAAPRVGSPQAAGRFSLVIVIIAAHVLYLLYRHMFFREFRRVLASEPCLECGAPKGEERLSEGNAIECGRCHASRYLSSYIVPSRAPYATLARVSVFPALIAVGGIAALFGMVFVLPHVYGWMLATPSGQRSVPRLGQVFGRLPRELTTVIDLTVYMLLIAVVIRTWRARFSAYVDRAVRCRSCGHDLHGTPINEHGQGVCGECGAAFMRG